MASQYGAGAEGIFGSQARARILGLLAQSSTPTTGYAIAKDLGIGVSNVYPELKRLEQWSVVASRPDANGRKRFFLADEDLRRFLLKRIRILPFTDWFSAARVSEREALSRQAKQMVLRAPRTRPKAKNRLLEEEVRRPPEKDRALRRVRAKTGVKP